MVGPLLIRSTTSSMRLVLITYYVHAFCKKFQEEFDNSLALPHEEFEIHWNLITGFFDSDSDSDSDDDDDDQVHRREEEVAQEAAERIRRAEIRRRPPW